MRNHLKTSLGICKWGNGHNWIWEKLPLVELSQVTAQGIDIEYNKLLDRQRPCLEGDFNGGSNNIVQSNKSV